MTEEECKQILDTINPIDKDKYIEATKFFEQKATSYGNSQYMDHINHIINSTNSDADWDYWYLDVELHDKIYYAQIALRFINSNLASEDSKTLKTFAKKLYAIICDNINHSFDSDVDVDSTKYFREKLEDLEINLAGQAGPSAYGDDT